MLCIFILNKEDENVEQSVKQFLFWDIKYNSNVMCNVIFLTASRLLNHHFISQSFIITLCVFGQIHGAYAFYFVLFYVVVICFEMYFIQNKFHGGYYPILVLCIGISAVILFNKRVRVHFIKLKVCTCNGLFIGKSSWW